MATLEELLALRAGLERARFQPARTVQNDAQRIDYKTEAELSAALAALDRQIEQASNPSPPRSKRFYFTTSKGF